MPELREAGATLVAISPQLPEHSAKIAKRHELEFDVLSDAGNRVAGQWGLVFKIEGALYRVYTEGFRLDLERWNGDSSWTLPMPGRFVVDTGGRILAADYDPDYTRRPEPEETLAFLASLG